MDGRHIEFLVGLYFLVAGIDRTPNWFKVVSGVVLIILAFAGLNIIN